MGKEKNEDREKKQKKPQKNYIYNVLSVHRNLQCHVALGCME